VKKKSSKKKLHGIVGVSAYTMPARARPRVMVSLV